MEPVASGTLIRFPSLVQLQAGGPFFCYSYCYMPMERQVLVLTSWYLPYRVIRWQHAVVGLYKGNFDVVAEYGETVSSPSVTWALPAVVRLKKRIPKKRRVVRFSRTNVYLRDHYACQYCGIRKSGTKQLTMDHMIPRSAGGRTDWKNIVTACKSCNSKKGSQLCSEIGMFPANLPKMPESLPLLQPLGFTGIRPKEWDPYLIAGWVI